MEELSIEEIEIGRAKALENASDLIEDAKILFASKRYPRCYALAHLACEELGKVMMLMRIGIDSRLGKAAWGAFWKRFRNHKEKTRNILGIDYFVSPTRSDNSDMVKYIEDVTKLVHIYEDTKLVGLYTDYVCGNFLSPREFFQRDLTKAMLRLAKKRLSIISKMEGVTLGKIKDFDVAKIEEIRKSLFDL